MSVNDIHHRFEFPAEMSSARAARRVVESDLRADGYVGDVTGIMLLVSELVTNAVMHGHPPHAVAVAMIGNVVHVCVEDGDSSRSPKIGKPDAQGSKVGGHGLRLVEEIADEWGWDICAESDGVTCGKSVWFTIGPH